MKRKKINKTKDRQFELDCKKATALIQDYITGELEPDIASELEKHLSICPDCVAFLNTYKKTTDLVNSFYNKRPQTLKEGLKKSLRAKFNKGEA
ncbi:MAG: zf-HC2 domain-containing protein [Thermodesulfobacteriota bacterium]